ncbi:MAG: hypothetical protein HY040_18980 [Planctomycetes bacterium]|nr:hypothetical protein [Planctomycetota bacterium]
MFGQFLNDIKKGENLDLYVTLVLAIVLTALNPILSLFGVTITPGGIVPLTMSVLAALTVVLLVNRKKMESLERHLSRQTESKITTTFPESYSADLGSAKKILQIGIHLASNLNAHHDQYQSILRSRRASIRFLIVHPKAAALKMAAMRFAGVSRKVEHEKTRTESSLDVITKLMQDYPGRVELRVIDYLLEYAGLLIETPSGEEILYIERYTFRHYGGDLKPKFVYTRDDPWFRFIKEEMEELWKAAEPWLPPSAPASQGSTPP